MSTIPTDFSTLVVKIGTTLLSGDKPFDGRLLEGLIRDLAKIKASPEPPRCRNVLIVSSGAIGCGMNALQITERPRSLPVKQATAAVGQAILMRHYESLFSTHGHGLRPAQVLLTAGDLDNRQTYLNVRNTIKALFELDRVVPIVNENDSTATDELKFGDNDTLAAKIAAKIDADLLVILSDVDGLYDKNPGKHKDAKLIPHVARITPEIEALAGDTVVETSVGGMRTKLAAAKIACAAGVPMVITNGRRPHVISDILAERGAMTVFGTPGTGLSHRKRWIAFGRKTLGVLAVDAGARRALLERGTSLLPAGVTRVDGSFGVGAAVRVVDESGQEIARGLVNYASADIARIMGRKSKEITGLLGRKDFDEVVHRDNLVVL